MQPISADSELPCDGELPIDIPSWAFDSNDVQSETNLWIIDATPPVTPLNNQTIENAPDTLIFTKSMVDDLQNVLELKESDFKGVNFSAASPQQLNYMVSHSIDEMDMCVPEQLFPNQKSLSPTAAEVVQKSKSLEIAASEAMVKVENQNDELKEDQNATKSKTEKKKKKFFGKKTENQNTTKSKTKKKFIGKKKKKKNIGKLSSVISPTTTKLIALYIEQSSESTSEIVKFDRISKTASNGKTVLLSSKTLSIGKVYEWSIQILKSDVDLQV